MLNRRYRATRTNIERVIKTGISISGNFIYAKISKKDEKTPSFAIVVSKRDEKTSVGRHLIKRKISSYIEENLTKISSNFRKTIVFFLKKTNKTINFDEIKKDIDFILKKIFN